MRLPTVSCGRGPTVWSDSVIAPRSKGGQQARPGQVRRAAHEEDTMLHGPLARRALGSAALTVAVLLLSGDAGADGSEHRISHGAPLVLTTAHRPGDRLEIHPYGDDGELLPEAQRAISRFLRCVRTRRVKQVDPRLIALIYQVSRDFRGREIEVVSGFRWPKPGESRRSRHWRARAIDLRVKGVSSWRLSRHVWRTYAGVGVGYYPRSGFVHLDVRELPVRWIDRPGRKVRYALHRPWERRRLRPLPDRFPPALVAEARRRRQS
jgi:uncharacterized protein YcbK (DUF882 family)